MKKVLVALILSLVLLIMTACGSDPVQDDLLTYINDDLSELLKESDGIIAQYDSVRGDNYTDDATMHEMITTNVLPQYITYIDKLEEVSPETTEVSEVHDILVEANGHQLDAFELMVDGLEAQDAAIITEANGFLDQAVESFSQFETAIKALAEEYDVEFK